jgi:hypothetical protein
MGQVNCSTERLDQTRCDPRHIADRARWDDAADDYRAPLGPFAASQSAKRVSKTVTLPRGTML